MSEADYLDLTISELAPLIKERKVSPVELTEAALARADRLQPRLNSFITILHDEAMREAKKQEAALARGHALSFGAELETFVTAGYLDGRVFVLYDDCPCLVYGPLSRNIHAFDEGVNLESVQQITGTIALFVAEWCGLESIP